MPRDASPLLEAIGRRTRRLRRARALTLRALADESGLSPRFLMEVEAGRANISVRRLADLAGALQTTAADLLATDDADATPRVIALLGLRGAGKTTVGRALAQRLKLPFVELDQAVEERAGLAIGEIFSLHGEEYYRRVERDTLAEVLSRRSPMVLAVGGGLVTSAEAYNLLREQATTIWLKARPRDYWTRVVRQGDRRPIDAHPRAKDALKDLVARRGPLYARADISVDTAGLSVAQAVDRVDRALKHYLR